MRGFFYIIFLITTCTTFWAQEPDSTVVKELSALRSSYKALPAFSVSVYYSLYLGNSVKASENYSAKLIKKGPQYKLTSKEQTSIVSGEYSMVINHKEKMVLFQETLNSSEVDPSAIDIDILLKMASSYEKIEKLPSSLKGYRFKFSRSQYRQIEVIYSSSSYFIKELSLFVRVPKNKESQRLVIKYSNMNTTPNISSSFFNLDKYITVKNNKAELTSAYKNYKLIN